MKNYVSECSSLVVILWLEYAIHQLLRQYIDIYMEYSSGTLKVAVVVHSLLIGSNS